MSSEILFSDNWDLETERSVENLKGPILIIGASGFIGSKLFFSLARRRKDVFAASPSPQSSWRMTVLPSQVGLHQLVSLDITKINDLQQKLAKIRPRTVFNLSAYGAYERQNNIAKIHSVNYIGTLNLIQVLSDLGCDAFVQAGSSSEYGLNCTSPKESDPLAPNSDYSVSKGASALLIAYYGKIHSFPCVNLRLYSVYGPYEDSDRLIPRIIECGLERRYPSLANPETSRDFVYIDDCTRAFVDATNTVCRTEPGLSLNICTGQRTTLADVAVTAKFMFDIKADAQFGSMPSRKWDLSNWYGDAALAKQKMGWTATTKFADGLGRTREWSIVANSELSQTRQVPRPKKISAVVVCYRDHLAIPIMHERLCKVMNKIGVDYEIIFVNDRSPADDEAVILKLCQQDHHVVGISHSRNFGSQAAFLSGMGIATGDAVALLDGDLQDPPELIEKFYEKWIEGYDVTYGIRVKRETVWYMQVLYKMFYRLFRYVADVEVPVDAGDFSLIDRKVVQKLLSFPERDVFLRGLRAWVGFHQTGVEYERPERMFGRSTNNFLKNVWWAKKAIFSFSSKPLGYIQGMGLVVFSMSIILSIVYIGMRLYTPSSAPHGFTTIIVFILAIGGLQIFATSILGDYLGKVLEEVKKRPQYIRAKVFTGQSVYKSDEEITNFIRSRQN